MRLRFAVLLLVLTVGFTNSRVLRAEPVGADAAGASERLLFLQQTLDDEYTHARYWYYGFTGLYATSTVASFGVAASTRDTVVHITQGVSAWQSLLATAGMLLGPMPSASAAAEIRIMPGGMEAEQKAKLTAAEDAVRTSAETQDFTRSWINHAISVGVAGIGAAVIRYSYGKRIDRAGGGGRSVREATISFWASVLVSEVQIWSMPTISLNRWSEYDHRAHPAATAQPQLRFYLVPLGDRVIAGVLVNF